MMVTSSAWLHKRLIIFAETADLIWMVGVSRSALRMYDLGQALCKWAGCSLVGERTVLSDSSLSSWLISRMPLVLTMLNSTRLAKFYVIDSSFTLKYPLARWYFMKNKRCLGISE